MANDLTVNGKAGGKPPMLPTSVRSAISGDEWDTRRALAVLGEERNQVPQLAEQSTAACRPMDEKRRVQRLTALGMVMSPNRPPAEASVWVREVSRLLSDIAEDVLCDAIDTLQKRLKFLPTVSEIRELTDPEMNRRRKEAACLDAMKRYLESGQPIGRLVQTAHQKPVIDRRGESMSDEETAELNQILENLGACSRYRPDGSRYEVSKRTPSIQRHDRPQTPTRSDYIAWGVDPAVLDKIEAEKAKKSSHTRRG